MAENFDRLDQGIGRFYGSKNMSADMLTHLVEQVENSSPEEKTLELHGKRTSGGLVLAAVAATVCLLVGFQLLQIMVSNQWHKDISRQVAKNHLKALEMEHRTGDYSDLAQALGKLDFALTEPQFESDAYRLLGGRYCSIDQQIAAQIDLENTSGEKCTLYQFKLQEGVLARYPQHKVLEIDGLIVELWQENGVGMGLARPRN